MKINFLKGVKATVSAGVFTLLLIFVGSSVSAQNVTADAVGFTTDKALIEVTEQYGSNYMPKSQFETVIQAEIQAVRDAQETGGLSAAEKAVKLTFLAEASTYVRMPNVSFSSAMTSAYYASQVRAEDFTVNVNTLSIFEEYYDLFTL